MPANEAWETVQCLEEIMALVVGIEDHRRVIRSQAWRSGSFDQIYIEAQAQGRQIERLHRELRGNWERITGMLQGKSDG